MSDYAADRMARTLVRSLYPMESAARKDRALIDGGLRLATIVDRKTQQSRHYSQVRAIEERTYLSIAVSSPEKPNGPDIRILARWFGIGLICMAIGLALVAASYFVAAPSFGVLSMGTLAVGSVISATVLLANERNEVGLFRE